MTAFRPQYPRVDPIVGQVVGLLDPAEQELLASCAVPRSFDADVLESVLMPGSPRRLFDGLIALGLVEARGGGSVYRLPAAVRSAGLSAWTGQEQSLRDLFSRLARHWEAERPEEAFYHLILADPHGAAKWFETQFAAYEDAFDLAGCETLLAILDERLADLSPELRRLRDEYRLRHARRLRHSRIGTGHDVFSNVVACGTPSTSS